MLFFTSFIFLSFFKGTEIEYLTNSYLLGLFRNTFLLSLLTALISCLIAVPLAILVTFYNFPGSKFFSWALSLSIAFPAYVYAFIFVGIFEYSSPTQVQAGSCPSLSTQVSSAPHNDGTRT